MGYLKSTNVDIVLYGVACKVQAEDPLSDGEKRTWFYTSLDAFSTRVQDYIYIYMNTTERDKLEAKFRKEIQPHTTEIDPDDQHDWLSLTLGWALAQGLSPGDSYEFAVYIRYNTDMA